MWHDGQDLFGDQVLRLVADGEGGQGDFDLQVTGTVGHGVLLVPGAGNGKTRHGGGLEIKFAVVREEFRFRPNFS